MGGAGIVVKKKKQRVFGNSLFYPRIQPRIRFDLFYSFIAVMGALNSFKVEEVVLQFCACLTLVS